MCKGYYINISEIISYSVGDLATACGCMVESVRYYEKAGLMPSPPRTMGGHRIYSLKQIGSILFYTSTEEDYLLNIKDTIEKDSDTMRSDIHIWTVRANYY